MVDNKKIGGCFYVGECPICRVGSLLLSYSDVRMEFYWVCDLDICRVRFVDDRGRSGARVDN